MLENYIPVLIFICVGLFVGIAMITLGGFVMAPRKPDAEKNSPMSVASLPLRMHG